MKGKRVKKIVKFCPNHPQEPLWQVNHGYTEDIWICQVFKCGYKLIEEGSEPKLRD